MNKILYLLLAAALPLSAEAQINYCNGRWTNLPCGTAPATSLGEAQQNVLSPGEAMANSRKKSLYHELNMKNIQARRDYDVELDLREVEQFCLEQDSSVDDCRTRIDKMDDRLTSRVNEVKLLREKELANKIQIERNEIEAQTPQVVIVEQQPSYWDRRPHHRPYWDRRHYGEGTPSVVVNQQVVVEQNKPHVNRPSSLLPPSRSGYRSPGAVIR